ncbi:MAG: hypothetical protein ACO2PN_18425 [Pyrobaculum sp.]|jgi:hypothetical protein
MKFAASTARTSAYHDDSVFALTAGLQLWYIYAKNPSAWGYALQLGGRDACRYRSFQLRRGTPIRTAPTSFINITVTADRLPGD